MALHKAPSTWHTRYVDWWVDIFFTYARCLRVKDGLYALPIPGVEMGE